MSTTKLTGTVNFFITKYAVGHSGKKNQVKMSKVLCFSYITSLKRQGSGSESVSIEEQDRDRYRSEKQDPDPDQKGLDPQHWSPGRSFLKVKI
jgi:hypothetical protein